MNRLSALKWAAAVALTTTAAVHVALVPEHLREAPYAGGLFIALSLAAAVLTILLATAPTRLAWLAAGSLAAAAITAYVYSRAVGLPLMSDDVGDWSNPLGTVAVCAEAAVIWMSWFAMTSHSALRGVEEDVGALPGIGVRAAGVGVVRDEVGRRRQECNR
jgi:hypothetical protein